MIKVVYETRMEIIFQNCLLIIFPVMRFETQCMLRYCVILINVQENKSHIELLICSINIQYDIILHKGNNR